MLHIRTNALRGYLRTTRQSRHMLPSFWSLRQNTQHIVARDAIGTEDKSLTAFHRGRICGETTVYASVLDSAGESWRTRRHCESLVSYICYWTLITWYERRRKEKDGLYIGIRHFSVLITLPFPPSLQQNVRMSSHVPIPTDLQSFVLAFWGWPINNPFKAVFTFY